jgi:hypothetical protein
MKPSRSLWLVLVVALGAVAIGCGPKEKFCIDRPEDNYRCLPQLDARVQSDGYDGPEEERGVTVIAGDDGGTASPDAAPDAGTD